MVSGQGLRIFPSGPFLARNIDHPDEILAYGFIDVPSRAALDRELARVIGQEAARHDRIADIIESITLRGVYKLIDEFDFSTDQTVALHRPEWL